MSIKLVLADDHTIVIDGLRALLRESPEFDVIGAVSNGADALNLILTRAPDLALIDMAMPGVNGNSVMKEAVRQGAICRFIVLSMHSSAMGVARALRNGASGYVLKEAAGSELLGAIRAVMAGDIYLSLRLEPERAAIEAMLQAESRSIDVLSARERDVTQRVVRGHETEQIASDMGISVKTVATYRSRIMSKLGVTNVASLIRFAIEQGIEPL